MTIVKEVPNNRKTITTKWVFTIKRDEHNNITKYKARLVARGFTKVFGIDFELTYFCTLNSDSLKFIISIASYLKWNIYQLEVKAAYLNANLDKDIYTTIPPGDKNYKKGFWKLNKALYGLRQSGRQWFETISIFIKEQGFHQLKSYPCIFRKLKDNKIICLIGIYVNDDMIISCSNYEINDIINKIKSKFKIFNYGPIKYLLGITIEQTKFEYRISQTNFIENLLSYNIKITQNKRTNIP